MKKPMYLMLFLFVWSCQNDVSTTHNSTQEQQATPVSTQSSNVGVKPSAPTNFVGEITLAAEQKTVKAGESFCMELKVANFQGILSTQYTLSWDPGVLEFEAIQSFKLPYMDQQDFGLPLTVNGKLTCVWIDDSLKGVSLPDGSSMYEICFVANPAAGGKTSPVEFVEKPTPFESVNLREKLLEIKPINGSVSVQ